MYSILIVDDEIDVRRAIIDIIDWDELGFRLAGEAGNGQEALALIEETAPDVILTDIKMPFMDGITLAQQVREVNPVTKIVFLTGFNDFDYAISAIKLNVIEYLLKPISAKNLTETLLSIKGKLDEEQRTIRDMELLREGYHQSRDLRRMSFLISLVTESFNLEPEDGLPTRQAQEYGLRLTGESLVLFALSLDHATLDHATVPTDDLELLKFSLANTVRTIASKYLEGEVFIFGSVIIAILSDTTENLDAYAEVVIQEVHQSIPLYYGFTVTIGVSEYYRRLGHTRAAYRSALTAIRYRSTLGKGQVIYISDVEKGKEFVPVFDEAMDMRFTSIVKTGTTAQLEAFLTETFHDLAEKQARPESYRIGVIEMYAALLRSLKSVTNAIEPELQAQLEYDPDLFDREPDALREWLLGLCLKGMEVIQRQQKSTSGVVAERGYQYIRSHYSDPDISLKHVSRQLHISASYFSAIFKKETGMSFTDALIRIRMEAARDLLLTGQHKIFEIAAKTGYADQHYFSYCFKKYFGQSPNEMRTGQTPAPLN